MLVIVLQALVYSNSTFSPGRASVSSRPNSVSTTDVIRKYSSEVWVPVRMTNFSAARKSAAIRFYVKHQVTRRAPFTA